MSRQPPQPGFTRSISRHCLTLLSAFSNNYCRAPLEQSVFFCRALPLLLGSAFRLFYNQQELGFGNQHNLYIHPCDGIIQYTAAITLYQVQHPAVMSVCICLHHPFNPCLPEDLGRFHGGVADAQRCGAGGAVAGGQQSCSGHLGLQLGQLGLLANRHPKWFRMVNSGEELVVTVNLIFVGWLVRFMIVDCGC